MNVTQVNNVLPGALPGVGGLEVPPPEPSAEAFAALYQRAAAVVDKVAGQFIATALVYPLLEQMSDSPFKTEMFDGGYTEKAFQQQLNTRMADDIATSSKLDIGQVLSRRMTDWLKDQSPATWQRVAGYGGIDING